MGTMRETECVSCAICKQSDYTEIAQLGVCRIVQCRECGLYYLNPRLKRVDTNSAYPSDYFVKSNGPKELKLSFKNVLRAYYRRWLSNIQLSYVTRHKKSGRILDIGCGTGEFLSSAKRHGWDTYGVDISEYASAHARSRGILVTTGTLPEAKFKSSFFDSVTLFDVFSHLPDPLADFAKVNTLLKSDGIFVFATGNQSRLPDSLRAARWGRPDEHYWTLNDNSLELLLAKSGFRVIERRINPYGLLTTSPKDLLDLGVPKWIVSLLFFPIEATVIGPELMVVCQKSDP